MSKLLGSWGFMSKRTKIFLLIALLILFGTLAYVSYRSERSGDPKILYGNVDVRQVQTSFRVSGRVISMPFQEGDLVKQDTLMGVLDPQPYLDEVRRQEAALEGMIIQLKNANLILDRRIALKGDGGVSQEDYEDTLSSRDQLKASVEQTKAALGVAMTNLKDTKVYAPNDGTILTRVREPGSVVREGDPIYTLSLLSPVWVRAFVSETTLGKIYPGMRAIVTCDGGCHYEGQIGFISPVAEFTPKTVETTQLRADLVYRIRVIVNNPDLLLKQGMPVTVKLLDDHGK